MWLKQNQLSHNLTNKIIPMKNTKLFFTYLSMLVFYVSFGQERKITGTVLDKNEPIPGAIVVIKGTSIGTQTDFDGKFSISAKNGESLIFKFVGYYDYELEIGEKISNYTIILKPNNIQLEETYGDPIPQKRKIDIAITPISKEDIEKESPKPEKTQVGIHCMRSIKGNEKPLVVINGFISTEDTIKQLNPNNIKSIEVLKGTSATAIYGSKGVNGVILITTQNLTKKELRKLRRKSERDYETEEKEKVITPLQNRI